MKKLKQEKNWKRNLPPFSISHIDYLKKKARRILQNNGERECYCAQHNKTEHAFLRSASHALQNALFSAHAHN